jgi:hypothetical protein
MATKRARKRNLDPKNVDAESLDPTASAPARLVYTHAPVLLAKLVRKTERGWIVDLGTIEKEIPIDASVDPALLDEAFAIGARVLVDGGASIVGAVATRRAMSIDPDGRVSAKVKSLEVVAEDQVLLQTPGAFVRAKAREVEIYGDRVMTRARDLAKILAAMIKLN